MNQALLLGLSALIATTAAPIVVLADDISSYPVSPTDLADIAYSGGLNDEGIPGYQELAVEYDGGITNARDVLRAAVKAGTLPSRVMQDDGYLESLRLDLEEMLRSTPR